MVGVPLACDLTHVPVKMDGLEATVVMVRGYLSTHVYPIAISFSLDRNECGSKNGGCEQNCHNTVGSFYCSCRSGYSISSDNLHCKGKENTAKRRA